ncbi:MAG: phosphoribosylglycinamide formyltransferase [Ignavibacteriales bacterium]|nr:phosphoribosylglycinamide formyltransferase [Ignavibacteriales bacterium]
MFKLAVFVSGRGSNLKSLFEKIDKKEIKISAVVSNKKNCGAVEFATQNLIPVFFVSNNSGNGFLDYEDLVRELKKIEIDLIVLAGFLKKIPDDFIDHFENKIINIHPALLPKYGGAGMYGMNVHRAVFENKEKYSGATVHFVDKIYDHGGIIEQQIVDISDANSPEEVAHKVLEIEHELLPRVVKKIAEGIIN